MTFITKYTIIQCKYKYKLIHAVMILYHFHVRIFTQLKVNRTCILTCRDENYIYCSHSTMYHVRH